MTSKTTVIIWADTEVKHVLMVQVEKGWSLPEVSEGPHNSTNLQALQKAIKDQLGYKVALGRQLLKNRDEHRGLTAYVYEAQLLQEDIQHARWFKKEDFTGTITDDKYVKVLNAWFDETEIPNLRAPWFQGHFYQKAEAWIDSEVRQAGLSISGDIQQIKATDYSLVMLVPTIGGNLYFKATGTAARYEASISQYLDKKYPGKSTAILAVNERTGWFLMNDMGGSPLRIVKDKEIWQQAILEYAKFQIDEIKSSHKLIQIGVPDRRISKLKDDINMHLEGMCDTGLSPEQKEKVMKLQPELLEMCDELEALLPIYTLDHGDLHSANIQLVNESYVFLDWGDAVVTHPFFSTRVFWNSIFELVETESEWIAMIDEFRPIYLEPWTEFAPMEKLEKALRMSDQLGCIHRALSWYLHLTPTVEDKSDYNKPSQWLQALLEEREFASAK
ncbi:phosphotransferase [Bacillus salitolerans]|uniref:Phosphotransferase n=1 Tax=Bacillus salitolerans TaxID=1437434 RepID=A0ABW4LRZ1_9BACI